MSNREKLTKEEKGILESFEKGEWRKARSSKILIDDAKTAAQQFLKKDARTGLKIY
ncbi:MAG TPA: hypothetical protein VEL47_06615 [Myxococcota bacterium]|nr:hypothetical protein [Myxococcota bacterium]